MNQSDGILIFLDFLVVIYFFIMMSLVVYFEVGVINELKYEIEDLNERIENDNNILLKLVDNYNKSFKNIPIEYCSDYKALEEKNIVNAVESCIDNIGFEIEKKVPVELFKKIFDLSKEIDDSGIIFVCN